MGNTVKNRIGERYGRLIVVDKAPSKHGYARWSCICDCGKIKNVSGTCLQQGRIKSCGCLRKEICKQRAAFNSENNKLSRGEAASNLLYAVYRHNAGIRDREFSLTKEQFLEITSSNCYYCGTEPQQVYKSSTPETGNYIYNGVDRVDNSLGYNSNNCVACCKTCNWMKRTQSVSEFILACNRVSDYNNHKRLAEMSSSAI